MKKKITINIKALNDLPAFAAYFYPKKGFKNPAQIAINPYAFLEYVKNKTIKKSHLPYFIAECIMHEIIHVLERWAKVKFSEKKIEELLFKARPKRILKG